MGLYKAQFISMIIMVTIGIGIFVGFNMEWTSIEKNTASFFESTGYADFRIMSETGFTQNDLQKILDIKDVKSASRYLSVNTDIKEKSGDSIALTVTSNENVSGMLVTNGAKYDKNSKDGIWLSDKYADINGIKLGDTLTFVYKNIEIKGTVKGLVKSGEYLVCVRDNSQIMPDYNTYGFAYISPEMYKKSIGIDFYPQINVISDMDKKDFVKAVDKELGNTTLILTKDESVSYASAKSESEEGQTMGSIMPVLFLLIAVLTMVTTMHRLTAKEKTQIGTLKALGFKDKRILRHYTSYAFMIGIIGSVIGIILGYGIAWYVMNPDGMMGTYFDMPDWKISIPWFCYVILLAIIVLLTLIGFLSVKQMLKGTAADALRPYTPKKMKPMAVEKTDFFHKLSFGTRWNLRDIMRHKSRTAMSLIGIIGCMMIIICALGMRDTIDEFLDVCYDGAFKYSSRIYLSENASNSQGQEIADKYNGDWSATVNVQLKEKAVNLDVYSLEHNKVHFPDENSDYINIKNNGAYICKRISDEFNLSEGDTIKVSPYGSDKEYTLKISGIIRSVSESIVISSKYADEFNIPYTIDSIYTDTDKKDIAADTAVKSVQSKQMIMDSFKNFMSIMNTMILIFIAGAVILGIVVLYNLGVMSYTERYREMATLKVVGFKDKKIGRLLIEQNIWLTLVGIIIGLPCGAGTLGYLMKTLAGEYETNTVISWASYLFGIILIFGVSLLVSFMVSRKNKKIDMVEALKGAE